MALQHWSWRAGKKRSTGKPWPEIWIHLNRWAASRNRLTPDNLLRKELRFIIGARGGSRTRTPRRAKDFKSSAYAIPPPGHCCSKSILLNHLLQYGRWGFQSDNPFVRNGSSRQLVNCL